jgi:MFS family permease
MRAEGTLAGSATRYRNYAGMATLSAVAGVFCSFFALPFGALSLYYGRKGIKQRRDEGRTIAGMVIVMIFGVLEILGGIALIGFFIWAMVQAAKQP